MIWLLLACVTDTTGWVAEVHGRVVDMEGRGIPGAEVVLADGETGEFLGVVDGEEDGSWRMPVLFRTQGTFPVVIQAESAGRVRGLSWAQVFLEEDGDARKLNAGSDQSLDMFQQRLPPVILVEDDLGSAAGSVMDASTGDLVEHIPIALRLGWNAPDSQAILGQTSTNGEGAFWIDDFEAGVYTAQLDASAGYAASRFMIVVRPGGMDSQVGLVSAPVAPDELRAALAWSGTDMSLGLHVSGPLATDGARGRYQVHLGNPVHPVRGDPVAGMEYVVRGLESAVIYSVRSSGEYRISAHILNDGSRSGEPSLSAAGAQVQIWWSEGQAMALPTPGVVGNLWNAMEFDASSGSVRNLQHYEPIADPFDLDMF